MPNIIFFNHYHRGDLHTHKEFIRQIQTEHPDFNYTYLHQNPVKLTDEMGIQYAGSPVHLSSKESFYGGENTLYINTWVGCQWDVFCKHGGINMHTLYEQWEHIYDVINNTFDTELELKESKEEYLPRINYSFLYLSSIDSYVKSNNNKKILICNNAPNSNQSFSNNMEQFIIPLAEDNKDIHFILTNKLSKKLDNILYTEEIIQVKQCDLQEISYLSKFCDSIIGKNSGPYVFCETYDNYMDSNKTFISFNTKHPDYDDVKETMSNGLNFKCKYTAIPIDNILSLSSKDQKNIEKALRSIL